MEPLKEGKLDVRIPRVKVTDMIDNKGLFGGNRSNSVFKWINFVFCLAVPATVGLGIGKLPVFASNTEQPITGIYGSGLSIKAAFCNAAATSFGCSPPL